MLFLKKLNILLLLGLFFVESKGQSEIKIPNDDEILSKSVMEGNIDADRFAILDTKLQQSKLTDIAKKKNIPSIGKAGDFSFICFKGEDGSILSFQSRAMSNAKDYEITTISLQKSKFAFSHECRSDKQISERITFANGIGLGLTKEKILKLLGKPTFINKERIEYIYRNNAVAQTEKDYTRSLESGIQIFLTNGKSEWIIVYSNFHFEEKS